MPRTTFACDAFLFRFLRSLHLALACVALACAASPGVALAQTSPAAVQFLPAAPTSADTIIVKVPRTCGATRYRKPAYEILSQTTRLEINILTQAALAPACQPATGAAEPLLIELGPLPAGTYNVSVFDKAIITFEFTQIPVATNLTLTVTDRRQQTPVPRTRINYTDHWWDAADAGAGFMIWHSANDELLLVWFSYGPDGKPIWYSVQGGSWVTPTRYDGLLVRTSRAASAGTGFAAISSTQAEVIGAATLDVGGSDGINEARFSYRLAGTTSDVVRNLRRFGK